MASVTLQEFRERARERADMENSRFISDAELNRYINLSITELYDLLITSRGENYYVSSYSFTTTGGTDSYALPSGMLKLLGVDLVRGANSAYSLKSFKWQERNRFREPYFLNDSINLEYQIRGSNLVFTPVPQDNQSIKLWYIPAATALVQNTDAFDGINGWEEYVVIDAAIKMLVKEESDVQELLLAKEQMRTRILQASSARDSNEPPRVVDTAANYYRSWY